MLVLSRHVNEGIRIDQQIRVVVVDIKGDKVRLGVQAPGNVPVHRDEVHEAIQREGAKETERHPRLEKAIKTLAAFAEPRGFTMYDVPVEQFEKPELLKILQLFRDRVSELEQGRAK